MAKHESYTVVMSTGQKSQYAKIDKSHGNIIWDEHKAHASSLSLGEAAALRIALESSTKYDYWVERH